METSNICQCEQKYQKTLRALRKCEGVLSRVDVELDTIREFYETGSSGHRLSTDIFLLLAEVKEITQNA